MQKADKKEKQISAGDIVMLKSGGPRMVVSSIYNEHYWCKYYQDKSFKKECFSLSELKLVK